jgi:homoserine kinase
MSSSTATRAMAMAPASVANVAVGFDLLGFSIDVACDKVIVEKTVEKTVEKSDRKTVEKSDSNSVQIVQVSGLAKSIPQDPAKNTATAGLLRLRDDLCLPFGFRVSIEKGIPLSSGMGGSAASAVAALVAANALLDKPLSGLELMAYALIGEAQASGSYHADNVAPSFCGGLTLSQVQQPLPGQLPKVQVTSIPIPKGIHCVLIHPHLAVETKQARGILKKDVSLKDHIAQSANLAGFLAGCFRGDLDLIRHSFSDLLIEPQRAHLIPGFVDVKKAAMAGGALGCSISGAGPSVFAWVEDLETARQIQAEMTEAFRRAGVSVDGWSVPLNTKGAQVMA